MASKGQENLIPMNKRSKEEVREIASRGGVNSGKARREKTTMKRVLKMMLDEVADVKGNKKGLTYREMATLGLINGAINGKAENYKTILETMGELMATSSDELNKLDEILLEVKNNATK